MSSNDLNTLTQNSNFQVHTDSGSHSKSKSRSYAWLLPVSLLLGFTVIFILLFGERFLPATEVQTAQVITMRAGDSGETTNLNDSSQESTAVKGDMLFQASGWVEPDPYTIYVPTLKDGIVKNVHVLEGQQVKQGQLLAELIDDDAKLIHASATQKFASMEKSIAAQSLGKEMIDTEIARAISQIETAEIRIKQGQDELDRFNNLAKGTVSDQQKVLSELKLQELKSQTNELRSEIPRLDIKKLQLNAELESMQGTLNELQTQIDTAKLALDRTKIYSPIDGIVLRLHAAPGKKRVLMMDEPTSNVIVELYNPEKLQARIDVPLNEAASMRLDQIVELKSDLLPDRTFNGRVTRITGQADLQRNTLQAKIEINNPDPRLRPDMLVRAKFFATRNDGNDGNVGNVGNQKAADSPNTTTTPQSSGRLTIFVPESAIFDEQFVWIVTTDNKAELRKLTLGSEHKPDFKQALDGVKSGEQVILPPFDEITAGTRVRITNSTQN